MFHLIDRTCLFSTVRWKGLQGIAAALLLAPSAVAQDASRVETLGGTGDAGFSDGVKGSSQFNSPTALALRGDGRLFIADYNNNAVRSMRLSDTVVTTFASANRPVGLVFDSRTNIFIANQGNGTITKYDYFANARSTYTPSLSGGSITALAIDRSDNLYIAQLNGVITRLDTNGTVTASFSAPAGTPHEFRGITVTDDGDVLASDAATHVIWRFKDGSAEVFAGTLNQSGNTEGERGYGRLNRPHQIAIGPNKSIVVADRGNHQVRVVSCAGVITTLYGMESSRWTTVDGDPNVIWPDLSIYPGWYDSPISGEFSELREPVGIAVDRVGNVYDSEVYYNVIRGAQGLQFPLNCAGTVTPPASTNKPPSLVLSPSSGFYPRGVTVIISAENSEAGFPRDTRIFYTLNGTVPTTSDTLVPILGNGQAHLALPGPVDLASLRVRAFFGEIGGEVGVPEPTEVPLPILTPNSGYYPTGVDVVVTSTNGFPEGTLLYYTNDGTDPTTNSIPLTLTGSQGLIQWRDAQRDLRSLRVKAFLGPNQGVIVSGRAVSFPGESEVQGEVGVPPARNGFKAGIGSYYILPVIANLRDNQELRSLGFVVEIVALPGAPRLERTDVEVLPMSTNDFIQLLPASVLPPDSFTRIASGGTNRLALTYFGTNSGFNVTAGFATVALLGIQFRAEDSLGNTAETGDGYMVQITHVTGTSDGLQTGLKLKSMSNRTIVFENIRYREGDTAPAFWYNAGDFGDGVIENNDVNSAIFAAFGFRRPFPLSDAFAAVDVYRIGVLENVIEYSDAATILRRSFNFESPDVFRIRNDFGEWESSRTAARAFATKSKVSSFATTEPRVWSRDVTIVGGVIDGVAANQAVGIPVFMKANAGVSVAGMQFVAEVVAQDGAPEVTDVTFFPSSLIPPPTLHGNTVFGSKLPRTVYGRWDNLDTALQGTVLLGYVQFTTPSTVQAGQHYDIVFRNTGGASIDWETGALTAYLFEGTRGELWPWTTHPETARVSDDWKVHFFGDVYDPEAQVEADADDDGFSNVEEYLAGSDPLKADWHVKQANGHITFRWVGRSGKSYSVERTHDFKSWNAVTGRITGQDAFLEYNELAAPARAQFYRLNIH